MRKLLLTVISVLILVFSSVLIYHIVTEEPSPYTQTINDEDVSLADISTEIDDFILDENDDINIGEMI